MPDDAFFHRRDAKAAEKISLIKRSFPLRTLRLCGEITISHNFDPQYLQNLASLSCPSALHSWQA
jgi:hypothetical protein